MNAVSSKTAEAVATTASLFRTPKKVFENIPSLPRVAITGWLLGFLLAILSQLISIRVPEMPRGTLAVVDNHSAMTATLAAR